MADYVTKAELEATKVELLERLEKVETNLLKEFRKWAIPVQSAVKVHQAYAVGFDARLSLIEERLNDLERRG
jgi:hypothetical protein